MFSFIYFKKKLHFQLKEDDYLPLTICTECFSKLNLFTVFKTSCLEAQEVLSFIFIDKKPVEVKPINKYEEIIELAIEEKEEIEDEPIPIKEDVEQQIEELAIIDETDEVIRDENEIEMIEEEYLNDSFTEIEKGYLQIRSLFQLILINYFFLKTMIQTHMKLNYQNLMKMSQKKQTTQKQI